MVNYELLMVDTVSGRKCIDLLIHPDSYPGLPPSQSLYSLIEMSENVDCKLVTCQDKL